MCPDRWSNLNLEPWCLGGRSNQPSHPAGLLGCFQRRVELWDRREGRPQEDPGAFCPAVRVHLRYALWSDYWFHISPVCRGRLYLERDNGEEAAWLRMEGGTQVFPPGKACLVGMVRDLDCLCPTFDRSTIANLPQRDWGEGLGGSFSVPHLPLSPCILFCLKIRGRLWN